MVDCSRVFGYAKIRTVLQSTSLPSYSLHINRRVFSGMFVWNKITITHSCSFDDAVREALRLLSNIPEIKEKQKEMFKLIA